MKKTFFDDCFEVAKQIEDETYHLNRLSEAFAETGNQHVSSNLYRRVEKLCLIAEKIRKICREKVDADWNDAKEASGNMLKAALAVADKK